MSEYRCLASVGLRVVWSSSSTPNFVSFYGGHAMWLMRNLRPYEVLM